MKRLYLVRHAKSSWEDPFQDDVDRPLNKRGRRNALKMGKKLKEQQIIPEQMLSSPAERALSTCVILAEKIGYPLHQIETDRRLYHASEEQLIAVVRQLSDSVNTVMIFGHNPGLTDAVNMLSDRLVTDNLPTCAIAGFMLHVKSWKDLAWGKGKVEFFDYPKKE